MAMATASSSSSSVIFRGGLSSSPDTNFTHGRRNHNGFFSLTFPRSSVILPRGPITLTYARRKNSNSPVPSNKKKKTKKRLPENDNAGGERFDDDAVEALFDQLEEDLKNDLGSDEGDDEISEEDLARLEQELAEAFGISAAGENEDNTDNDIEGEDEDEDEEEEDEEEEEGTLPKLKNWQLRQLAYALKIGRRKTSIKNLAAEVCLNRAVVLQILREPPPELVLLSAALPDKIEPPTSEAETKPMETMTEPIEDVVEPESQVKLPVHAMQSRWSMQKRLKKVQIETLERVYLRSKRPTNAMVSSIVHVTNLPRKRVVQWFEEKRAEEGVPNQRTPYKRSSPETMITN